MKVLFKRYVSLINFPDYGNHYGKPLHFKNR
jgi:hypothetical protein